MDRSLDEIISERPVRPTKDLRTDIRVEYKTTDTHNSQRVADHLHPALVPAEVPHRRGLRAGRSILETAYERYVKHDSHGNKVERDAVASTINHQQLTADTGASSSLLSLNAVPPLPSSCDDVVQHAFEPRAPDDAGEVSGGGLR